MAPQGIKTRPREELSIEYTGVGDSADLAQVMDIIKWIGVEEDEIRPLTDFDCSRIDVKELTRVTSRRFKRLHWR